MSNLRKQVWDALQKHPTDNNPGHSHDPKGGGPKAADPVSGRLTHLQVARLHGQNLRHAGALPDWNTLVTQARDILRTKFGATQVAGDTVREMVSEMERGYKKRPTGKPTAIPAHPSLMPEEQAWLGKFGPEFYAVTNLITELSEKRWSMFTPRPERRAEALQQLKALLPGAQSNLRGQFKSIPTSQRNTRLWQAPDGQQVELTSSQQDYVLTLKPEANNNVTTPIHLTGDVGEQAVHSLLDQVYGIQMNDWGNAPFPPTTAYQGPDGRGIVIGQHKGQDVYDDIVDLEALKRKLKRQDVGIHGTPLRLFVAYHKDPSINGNYWTRRYVTENETYHNGKRVIELRAWGIGRGGIRDHSVSRPENIQEIPNTERPLK